MDRELYYRMYGSLPPMDVGEDPPKSQTDNNAPIPRPIRDKKFEFIDKTNKEVEQMKYHKQVMDMYNNPKFLEIMGGLGGYKFNKIPITQNRNMDSFGQFNWGKNIDVDTLRYAPDETYSTLAHEYAHAGQYNSGELTRDNYNAKIDWENRPQEQSASAYAHLVRPPNHDDLYEKATNFNDYKSYLLESKRNGFKGTEKADLLRDKILRDYRLSRDDNNTEGNIFDLGRDIIEPTGDALSGAWNWIKKQVSSEDTRNAPNEGVPNQRMPSQNNTTPIINKKVIQNTGKQMEAQRKLEEQKRLEEINRKAQESQNAQSQDPDLYETLWGKKLQQKVY